MKVSEATKRNTNLIFGGQRQKTKVGFALLPQRTMNRLASSRNMTLRVPTISNSFRNSTRKILTSMASISGQSLFSSLEYDNNTPVSDDEYFGGSMNETDSVCTADSFDLKRDGITEEKDKEESEAITINLSPRMAATVATKARKSSQSLECDTDEDVLGMKNRKSVSVDGEVKFE